jgi:hypothetical protein
VHFDHEVGRIRARRSGCTGGPRHL